jgi:hypothetical protein
VHGSVGVNKCDSRNPQGNKAHTPTHMCWKRVLVHGRLRMPPAMRVRKSIILPPVMNFRHHKRRAKSHPSAHSPFSSLLLSVWNSGLSKAFASFSVLKPVRSLITSAAVRSFLAGREPAEDNGKRLATVLRWFRARPSGNKRAAQWPQDKDKDRDKTWAKTRQGQRQT